MQDSRDGHPEAVGDEPTATVDEPALPAGELRRGASVGRYIVLGRLGAGGMGTVYTVYDPELERRVALKLLHPAPGPASADGSPRRGADRLLREAQALARLSHPHVLAVYDAGTVDADDGTRRVFLAGELVRGQTLAAWMAGRPRPRREVLRLFTQAGRGLAAAHEAGVVHRDFKPGNVMVGDDGRVRVVDFGLARAARPEGGVGVDEGGVAVAEGGVLSAADLAAGGAVATATRTGAVFGTPAYMAPEQRAGERVGPAADQYAFCVALWEALTGERPTAADLAAAASGDRRLPQWLRRALLRGLASDPAARHPSMEALLDALAADPARHRRLWVAAVALLGVTGAAGIALHRTALDRAQLCRGGEEAMAETWNRGRRAALAGAFSAGGSAYAEASFAASATALDRWAERWVELHRDACEATRVTGEQSPELLDLRVECLERRRRRLDRLLAVAIAVTEGPQPPPPDALAEAFADLPSLARCSDTRALLAAVPPPQDASTRRRVEALRGRLDEAAVLLQVGRYEAGLAVAEPLVDEAAGVGYWPLTAEALLVAARLEERSGEAEAAAGHLDRALDAAVA
ncbi:MAG TPA: serine/threonine-protein kinase, partial [Thermoanaerobaculia bacterium]|nr:serine/threonine-protein kinase [Thermoanaerobaculia bacterium]